MRQTRLPVHHLYDEGLHESAIVDPLTKADQVIEFWTHLVLWLVHPLHPLALPTEVSAHLYWVILPFVATPRSSTFPSHSPIISLDRINSSFLCENAERRISHDDYNDLYRPIL